MTNHRRLYVIIFAFFVFDPMAIWAQKPLVWDIERLEVLKPSDSGGKSILHNANIYIEQECPLITDKDSSFSGSKHNYESLSTYFWPQEGNPSAPWINKDGQKNPERLKYDGAKINTFSYRCKYFAQAYIITADTQYAEQYLKDVKSWFVDKKTKMNPNFEYAQIVPNTLNNHGRPHGIIDAYVMIDVVESLMLMRQKGVVDQTTDKKIKKWFIKFSTWLRESDNGIKQSQYNSNLSLAYDVMMCEFYHYIGDYYHYNGIVSRFANERLEKQFMLDGSQPQELKRAKPMSYCIYNLEHVLDFCVMQNSIGKNFYILHKQLIDAAANYIANKLDDVNSLIDAEKSDYESLKKKNARLQVLLDNLKR